MTTIARLAGDYDLSRETVREVLDLGDTRSGDDLPEQDEPKYRKRLEALVEEWRG